MSDEKIHFLDVASSLPGYRQSWSPNTLKTRLLLNAKQIPYTEQFVSYPDIAPLLASYGVEPNVKGTPYTLPAIYHPSSLSDKPGGILMGSLDIARHLDALFPNAPVHAFPEPKAESEALWTESSKTLNCLVFPDDSGFEALVFPQIPGILDPRGEDYFIRTRTEDHSDHVSPLKWGSPDPEDDFAKMVPAFQAYNEYLLRKRDQAVRDGRGDGPFLWGHTVSMGDIWLVSCLVWLRSAGEEWLRRLLAAEGVGMVRGVWEAFERNGWLTGQGEEKVLVQKSE